MNFGQLEEVVGTIQRTAKGGRKAVHKARSAAIQDWHDLNPEPANAPEPGRPQSGLHTGHGTSGADRHQQREGGIGNDRDGQPHTEAWAAARGTPVRRSSQQGSGRMRAGQGLYDSASGSVSVGSTIDARGPEPVRSDQTLAVESTIKDGQPHKGARADTRAGQRLYDSANGPVSVESTVDARRSKPVRSGQTLYEAKTVVRGHGPVRSNLALNTLGDPVLRAPWKRRRSPVRLTGDEPMTPVEEDLNPPKFTISLEGGTDMLEGVSPEAVKKAGTRKNR